MSAVPTRGRVVATAVGVVAGSSRTAAELLASGGADNEAVIDAAAIVGKRGLRYKDRATALAWSAAELALRDSGLLGADGKALDPDSVGVVASSNLGNADTVVRALTTITEETVTGTSPMDLPNASSNVMASSVAIRWTLRGPNMMICNGATSGLDALRFAAVTIRAGRAERMLVVGVESDTDVSRAVHGTGRVLDGGAAVLLESADAAAARGATALAEFGGYARRGSLAAATAAVLAGSPHGPGLLAVPDTAHRTPLAQWAPPAPHLDLAARFGASSGALGVLQFAAAVGFIAGGGGTVLAVNGHDGADASAALLVTPVTATATATDEPASDETAAA